jgi:amino acid transporter
MKAGFGQAGVLFASAAIMISVFGSLNGNILAGPRLLYAMGKEKMAPIMLQEVHPVYQTPYIAIMVLGVWSSVLVILGGVGTSMGMGLSLFDLLTNFSMFGAVIFETMGVLSIFVFRRIMPDFPRPYKCWGYPFTPLLYAVIPACVLGNMFFASHTNELGIVMYPHHAEVYSGITFLAVGVAVYYAFIKPYRNSITG